MTSDIDLTAWIGRSATVRDTIGATPAVGLTATLDHPAAAVTAGTPLPPLWHWLYFLPVERATATPQLLHAHGHVPADSRVR